MTKLGILDGKWPSAIGFILLMGVGIFFGWSSFIFIYARGYSYLSDNPKACVNCHIMQDQYTGWSHSSHHAVATCNSCHAPEGIASKWVNKTLNGFWHSYAFSTGDFHFPLQIRRSNWNITQKSCLKCHSGLLENHQRDLGRENGLSCSHCHKDVGH